VKAYIITGLVSYLIVAPLTVRIPTVTSLVASANQLLIIGLCLGCWRAWRMGNFRSFAGWLAAGFGLPVLTIISQGFLGYGVVALSMVLMFIISFSRPRWKGLAAAVLIGYVALSLYVTYMRDRSDIRSTVWGGQSLRQRVAQLYQTVSTIEWFGWHNQSHLVRIDQRLNQNYLVGVAVNNLSSGYRDYAEGETLGQAALAVIPRALWPEKPVAAGSPQIVTTYTGIRFAQYTSVGVGQVMEFYINFGTTGVILGFPVLGSIVALFDLAAARWLVAGDWQRFTLWVLPGLGFLQAGGSLVELTSTVAAGFATAILVNWLAVPALKALFELPAHSNPQLRPAESLPYQDAAAWHGLAFAQYRRGGAEDGDPEKSRAVLPPIGHSQNGHTSWDER
jgi:hypothetical protein